MTYNNQEDYGNLIEESDFQMALLQSLRVDDKDKIMIQPNNNNNNHYNVPPVATTTTATATTTTLQQSFNDVKAFNNDSQSKISSLQGNYDDINEYNSILRQALSLSLSEKKKNQTSGIATIENKDENEEKGRTEEQNSFVDANDDYDSKLQVAMLKSFNTLENEYRNKEKATIEQNAASDSELQVAILKSLEGYCDKEDKARKEEGKEESTATNHNENKISGTMVQSYRRHHQHYYKNTSEIKNINICKDVDSEIQVAMLRSFEEDRKLPSTKKKHSDYRRYRTSPITARKEDNNDDDDSKFQLAILESFEEKNRKRNEEDLFTICNEVCNNDDDQDTFMIELVKDKYFLLRRNLGITIDSNLDGKLRILNWRKSSLIAQWNDRQKQLLQLSSQQLATSRKIVRPNDILVAIDGIYVQGSLQKMKKILEDSDPQSSTLRLILRREGDDSNNNDNDISMPIMSNSKVRQIMSTNDDYRRNSNNKNTPMHIYSSLWYNCLGGDTIFLSPKSSPFTQSEYELTLQSQAGRLSSVTRELILHQKPSIVYLIFGGLLPPLQLNEKGECSNPDDIIRRGACLDRRYPAPLLRLLSKERDATALIIILDHSYDEVDDEREKKWIHNKHIPPSIADRITVRKIRFGIPRWPCAPILNQIRQMMMITIFANRGLFLVLDEMKAIHRSCFEQCFALYPILQMCSVYPNRALFLEWNPIINNNSNTTTTTTGEVYTYDSIDSRAAEEYKIMSQWHGSFEIRNHLRHQNQRRQFLVFNYNRKQQQNDDYDDTKKKKNLYNDN